MGNLRNRFERFCYNHRNWGIPNLMLYIAIGSAVVSLLGLFNGGSYVLYMLYFDKELIMQGQVWRLFTYIFTTYPGGLFSLFYIYFFYLFGKHLEQSMGRFRFNLYYFSSVLIMDVFAMLVFPAIPTHQNHLYMYLQMATYMHLSMMLTFVTMNPDAQFMLFLVIPIKAWIMSIIYLVIIASDIYNCANIFPCNLLPLAGLTSFLLFAGKDVLNLLPPSLRPSGVRRYRKVKQTPPKRQSGPIPYNPSSSAPKKSAPYTHRCTVCGRTDVTNPELEFRYCSKCNGYHCYCQDHINDHTHIE